MSLSSILDEIQDGASKPEDGETSGLPEVVIDPALEHLNGMPAVREKAKACAQYLYRQRAIEAVQETSTLDRVAALEVFTMLPLGNGRAPILTAAPSVHNKKELLSAIALLPERTVDHIEFSREVLEMAAKTLPVLEELTQVCRVYAEQLGQHLGRLTQNPPRVIDRGKDVNLLTCNVVQVAYMDTYQLQFPPYEGTLDMLFRRLLEDRDLNVLKKAGIQQLSETGEITLLAVGEYLLQSCTWVLRRRDTLTAACHQLTKITTYDSQMPYSQSLIDEVLSSLSMVTVEKKVFIGTDTLAEKAVACLAFLV